MRVTWIELTIIDVKTGQRLYYNTWVTNHIIHPSTVMIFGRLGRSRWKIENEGFNILKNQGYHLEHNFGHGKTHLSQTLFTLNVLAFLVHMVVQVLDCAFFVLRKDFGTRRKFFQHIDTLTCYLCFRDWDHLFHFMAEGRDVVIPTSLPLFT